MTTAALHVIGSAHEARFGESFDDHLQVAIRSARDPIRAAAELDELGLLTVLAHFAAAGDYRPDSPATRSWGLEIDTSNRRLRHHRFAVHYSASQVDDFVFDGLTLSPRQTVVSRMALLPRIDR